MKKLSDYIRLGISPSMLFPAAFDDELEHFSSIDRCCQLPQYESFETFLPHDPKLRAAEIKEMKEHGKILNYNTPGYFQLDGDYNASSDDPAQRSHALEAMKQHIDYAAEAGCSLMVFTGTPDKGPEKRSLLLQRYGEFFMKCAEYGAKYNITLAVEPIERGVFKNLILGPTWECAEFIKTMQNNGASNARLILDIAHLPLMQEDLEDAIQASLSVGLVHIHMGNAVLDTSSQFYGHTHPPIGVHKGCYDCQELITQFEALIKAGYISVEPSDQRAAVSLEVRPYPGVSGLLSAEVMYEKISYAFMKALESSGRA